jgi:hypothetical protein
MKRPRLLDLYSGVGGASVGYYRAGFDVHGLDNVEQPDYPFEYFKLKALEFLDDPDMYEDFDFIHASPPCQAYSAPTIGTNRDLVHNHPELIAPTREALMRTGKPWVMENVIGAPLRKDLVLCGEMFDLGVIMHRIFEFSPHLRVPQPQHKPHRGRVRGWRHGEYFDGPYVAAYGNGGGKANAAEIQYAKGIYWTTDHFALREAIPPAYAQLIGEQVLLQMLRRSH